MSEASKDKLYKNIWRNMANASFLYSILITKEHLFKFALKTYDDDSGGISIFMNWNRTS